MEELYLPTLSHFEHRNLWTGSLGALRFQVLTEDEMKVETWRGPNCYKLSQVEESAAFPVSQKGSEAMRAWILARSAAVNGSGG